MNPADTLMWIKTLVVAGLATYLSIFVLNNITDPGTNSAAIPRMMTMRELREDPPLGQGVLWRAIESPAVHRVAYLLVIAVQAVTALVLWYAVILLVSALFTGGTGIALAVANLGLALFVALFLGFVLTGLWFTYWVKMGPVQQSHLTLLLVGLASVVVVNLAS
ncbi:DUF2165 family protein [Pseudonocardia spinosispora]|uniref:DUF2165 family protein n=1 Tax=Pseudonocardia spinosispora TaxID=103441 RepID=UPI0004087CF4|nr:DUF2165 family protein [Pseudonocardia spinosispora]